MTQGTALSEATARVNAKIRFYTHLVVFLAVNTLLAIINLATSSSYLWFLWPLAGWGIGVVAHALAYFLRGHGTALKAAMIERQLKQPSGNAPPQI